MRHGINIYMWCMEQIWIVTHECHWFLEHNEELVTLYVMFDNIWTIIGDYMDHIDPLTYSCFWRMDDIWKMPRNIYVDKEMNDDIVYVTHLFTRSWLATICLWILFQKCMEMWSIFYGPSVMHSPLIRLPSGKQT